MPKTINFEEIQNIILSHKDTAVKLKRTTYKDRIKKLNSIVSYLQDRNNEQRLMEAMKIDLGRHTVEVLLSEIGVINNVAKYIKRNLKEWMKNERVATSISLLGASSYIIKEPKGSTLIIAPWNYPLQLGIVPLCYAIAAGNTAVIKPSEYSSATSAYMATMIAQIFDPKEITVVQGAVEETKILLDLPWDHIYFTGSTMVGKIIMKAAAERLSSVTLELGGKSPCIIDKSANIASVAKKLTWGKFLNNGQTCIAPDYVLVPKKMKSSLVAELKKEVKTQLDPNGIGSQANEDYGHIISERHHSRCVSLLEDAIQKGANIITGGEYDASSRFFAPTVLDNVTDDMKIMQEEIFGPILPIIGYTSKEEVVNIINNKPKPLALYIQSKDQKSIAFFIENTTAGGTVINDFMIHYANPHLPFGGVNNSGIGKSHGYYGFQEFTNERAVMRQRFGATSLLHPPFTARSEKLARILGKWLS